MVFKVDGCFRIMGVGFGVDFVLLLLFRNLFALLPASTAVPRGMEARNPRERIDGDVGFGGVVAEGPKIYTRQHPLRLRADDCVRINSKQSDR